MDPKFQLGDVDFTVTKVGYTVPIWLDYAEVARAAPISRRTRIRWWVQDKWDRRPRIHLGSCNHDDCY